MARNDAQIKLYVPHDLRDRIKAYAERRGTSMNAEIVHVLERQWPEQWPLGARLAKLADDMAALAAGKSDTRIQEFLEAFEETVEGIVSGRVTDMDLDTREAVSSLWNDYNVRRGEDELETYSSQYDEEEDEAMRLVGRPEKYAIPLPKRKQLGNLSDEEFKIYTMAYKDGLAARHETKKDDAFMRDADDSPFSDPEDDDK